MFNGENIKCPYCGSTAFAVLPHKPFGIFSYDKGKTWSLGYDFELETVDITCNHKDCPELPEAIKEKVHGLIGYYFDI